MIAAFTKISHILIIMIKAAYRIRSVYDFACKGHKKVRAHGG